MDNEQLYKRQNGNYEEVYPNTFLSSILDKESGKSLKDIISAYNHLYVPFVNNIYETLTAIPVYIRRKGLWVTWETEDGINTYQFNLSTVEAADDAIWGNIESWEQVPDLDYYNTHAAVPDSSITLEKLSDEVRQWLVNAGKIINYPDREDITEELGLLKFADREVIPGVSSMGYKILRRDKTFAEQVTDENTIYEIKYDFDLDGGSVTIPFNCILNFNGGLIKNGSIDLSNDCIIQNGIITISDSTNIIRLGNNCIIKNCKIQYNNTSMQGYGAIYGDHKNNIKLLNNIFKEQNTQDSSGAGRFHIRLVQCTNFEIKGNYMEDTQGEGIMVNEGTGIIAENTTIGCWSGIGTSFSGEGRTDITQIVISNNNVTNARAAGITINTNNVIVSNNIVSFISTVVHGPAIRLGHTHTKANKCLITNNELTVFNSTFGSDTTAGRGISIDAGNDNIVFGNKIIDFKIGIASSVEDKKGTIINNNFIQSLIEGVDIYFEDDSTGEYLTTISNNDIHIVSKDTTERHYGVYVRGGHQELYNNKIIVDDTTGDYALTHSGVFKQGTTNHTLKIYNCIIDAPDAIRSGNTSKTVEISNSKINSRVTQSQKDFGSINISLTGNKFYNIQLYISSNSYIENNYFYHPNNSCLYIRQSGVINISILNNNLECGSGNASYACYFSELPTTDLSSSYLKWSDNLLKGFNNPFNTDIWEASKEIFKDGNLGTYPATGVANMYIKGNKRVFYDNAVYGIRRTGTFAQKPSSNDIYNGFAYFCTDKQTTEGATNGIMIYHKGSDVWVDALGRTIS